VKLNIGRLARALHKWLGLALGLQLSIWSLSGFYMVAVDLDFIHGDFLVRPAPPLGDIANVLSLASLQSAHGTRSVRLKALPGVGHPVYEIQGHGGTHLVDALTGQALSPLSKETIAAIARSQYAAGGTIAGVELFSTAPVEARGRKAPLWRVDFDDAWRTSFYFDPDSGALLTKRHRWWRGFDAFWMLHVMDYGAERDDVNNVLLRTVGGFSSILALSGIVLLFYSFGWLPRRRSIRS